MPNGAAERAAGALLAYRRREGPADLRVRDLCRRPWDAMDADAGDTADGPRITTSPSFLAVGLDLLARRSPEVRVLVEALATAVGPSARAASRRASQVVRVTGSGNAVTVAGGDLRVTWPAQPRWSVEPEPASASRITVLFAAASPTDLARLRTDDEMREVREALELSPGRERFTLELRPGLRAHEFARALLQLRPRVVHFSGHGAAGTGELCFEDDVGCSQPASAEGLRGLFSGLGSVVECVVLNACHSHGNAAAIAESVPYVIGMATEVSDEGAIAFAVGFYQGLGDGMRIAEAHAWGAALMRVAGMRDPPPVLVERGG